MQHIPELTEQYQDEIAVISMAGRFPGADSVEQFWQNLHQGVESVRFFSQQELLASGVDPAFLENPNFVGAEGVLEGVELFDAEFFGFSPREAELLDPQHRIFLEVIWELLERAGYGGGEQGQVIGVYSGAGASSYLSRNLLSHQDYVRDVGTFKVSLATGQDFVSTRASYKLGLTGPSINVNTLCSSSAVAVHYAREALLAYQCDIAVAGGVTISNSREDALFYQEGGIGSFDGHCRAFDAKAAGTVAGNGIALVALKRMEDALQDGDQILGVLKGSAINNDGGDKASYTAPSPEGQARCITEALEVAGVDAATISYVEAHGTGTNLGDPIEISGLTRAYRRYTEKNEYCGIGSVKTNIGHLVSAGGVASMIKTVLAMQHRTLPASLNFDSPNPKIDFANSPFYVVDQCQPWLPVGGDVLRAGISSFGIGGTNAHLIVEEAPQIPPSDAGRSHQLILLSAKTATALETMKQNLHQFLQQQPSVNLADLAYTLQLGRRHFEYKFAAVASSVQELEQKLAGDEHRFTLHTVQKTSQRELCFMFPGQGSQYIRMGRALYQTEALFRSEVDRCISLVQPLLEDDLLQMLYPAEGQEQQAETLLRQTRYAQPALFITSYALVQLLASWQIKPDRMIGHSIGEYVAACVAGVFSLADALALVVKRGQLMQQMQPGLMLSVPLSVADIQPFLGDEIWHCVQNGPESQVLGGSPAAIKQLQQQLDEAQVSATELHTSHAFHSGMMEPALAEFSAFLGGLQLQTPKLPFISNRSGQWAGSEVTTAEYWTEHLRHTVRFADGISTLLADNPEQVFIEVGPGQTLSTLLRSQSAGQAICGICLPHPRQANAELDQIQHLLATLWGAGQTPEFAALYSAQRRHRICLPTYPFEGKRYWIEQAPAGARTFRPDLILNADTDSSQLTTPISQAMIRLELNGDESGMTIPAELWQKISQLEQNFRAELSEMLAPYGQVKNPGIELKFQSLAISGQASTSTASLATATSHSRPHGAPPYVAPSGELQQLLVQHWQEVLGYSPVGIHDNFFEVGGHSLMAAALVTRMRKQFDFEVPLRELLETPTIAELAELLENRIWLLQQSETGSAEVLEL
ncbi:type I polyketide synthase [Alkalimonas amylolytica]|uniref:Acyl transferase domain-containing protein n=1 Tax=Alkalimonas amylolytica TaxID=152573 RepID=A0A1H4G3J1_ALKAM|nr:type I polyketide synthase [Alkalimonas amylolytica]SEB03881.1 Acyl transferase domain-containing protein [Alkalimonas amylolytica]